MKSVLYLLSALCMLLCGCAKSEFKRELKGVLAEATTRYNALAVDVEKGERGYPYAFSGGELLSAEGKNVWASGYFPGSLWMLAEWNDDDAMRETAQVLAYKLNGRLRGANLHDFAMVVNAAHAKIYKKRETIRAMEAMDMVARASSNTFSRVYRTMENLEGDAEYYHRTAVWNIPTMEFLYELGWTGNVNIHAESVMNSHVREDGAVYEGMIYNKYTSEVIEPFSLHGMSATSAWSRGQAWALYGFTMLYRLSEEKAYLEQAERTAKYIMSQLQIDGIPNWDFDSKDELKDSSAAAIMASAFVDLYALTQNEEYLLTAERQLATFISQEYKAGDDCGGLLLKHGVGNRMTGEEVDAALIYGDYYLIEAIVKYLEVV